MNKLKKLKTHRRGTYLSWKGSNAGAGDPFTISSPSESVSFLEADIKASTESERVLNYCVKHRQEPRSTLRYLSALNYESYVDF